VNATSPRIPVYFDPWKFLGGDGTSQGILIGYRLYEPTSPRVSPFIFTFRGRYKAITGENPPLHLLHPREESTMMQLFLLDLKLPRARHRRGIPRGQGFIETGAIVGHGKSSALKIMREKLVLLQQHQVKS